jgi:pilus assembly protein CpaE
VYSLSGGTGKTTIATNVAAALKREGERVLLIDCSLQSGDVGIFLNLQNKFGLYDLLQDVERLLPEIENPNPEFVGEPLPRQESGLEVLLAPRIPQNVENINLESLMRLIVRLRGIFSFIVIDTASKLDDLNSALFEQADYLLHIVNPTLPCVANTRMILNLMDTLHYPADKSQLVMNRVNKDLEKARVAIPVAAIENNLKCQALGIIPMDERRILAAVNRGIPVIAKDKAYSPAKELTELADAVYALCKGASQGGR